ncbi:MAG: hypothetical protein CVU41_10730 [Chloroflexi bacterium HGW-Chloroflexi-3]|nr:MAG: hypothetical protein CVU41_10730 [Chloroflexi bacterium HGW-Chloroflexi-3]
MALRKIQCKLVYPIIDLYHYCFIDIKSSLKKVYKKKEEYDSQKRKTLIQLGDVQKKYKTQTTSTNQCSQ